MEIAKRMNAIKYDGHYNWPCGELDSNDEEIMESKKAFELKAARDGED